MKSLAVVGAVCFVLIGIMSADAKPHKGGQEKQKQPGPPPGPPDGPPSAQLSWLSSNCLEKILAPLDQHTSLPRGEVTQVQESFKDRSVNAPANEKRMYDAAVHICNVYAAAMDEREQVIANAEGSAAVHGPSDLGAHRKDNPTKRELRREMHEERNRKKEAAGNDKFLTVQLKTEWSQRATQIRQQIQNLTAAEREAERQGQASSGPASPAVNTITLDKPVQVKVKYGTATIQAGTTLPVVSRDANGVVVQYMGENVLLPP